MIGLFALQGQERFGVLCPEMLSHRRCGPIASAELLAARLNLESVNDLNLADGVVVSEVSVWVIAFGGSVLIEETPQDHVLQLF
jgi:hypothetical protein